MAPIGWMAAWERLPSDGPSWMGGGGGMHTHIHALESRWTCNTEATKQGTYRIGIGTSESGKGVPDVGWERPQVERERELL